MGLVYTLIPKDQVELTQRCRKLSYMNTQKMMCTSIRMSMVRKCHDTKRAKGPDVVGHVHCAWRLTRTPVLNREEILVR